MSMELPAIPGEFPKILRLKFIEDANKTLAAHAGDKISGLAEKYERQLTDELVAKVPGGDFLGRKVTRVDAAIPQRLVHLSGDVPQGGIPKRAEECDSFLVIAREAPHGPGLQPGFA